MTQRWMQHPGLNLLVGDVWLPVHFWLTGSLGLLLHNAELAARLLSFVLGIATLFVVRSLVRRVSGETASFLAVMIMALYTLQIAYSTSGCSEIPYLFFVLLGLLGYFEYRQSSRTTALYFGGLSLTVAAGIRYEAWLFIGAIGLLLLKSRNNGWKDLLAYCSGSGLWPIFWTLFSYFSFRDPLYFVHRNHTLTVLQSAIWKLPLWYALSLFPVVLLLSLSPVVVLAALMGFFQGKLERLRSEFAFIILTIGIIQAYQVITGEIRVYARYTMTLGTLLALFGAMSLAALSAKRGWRLSYLACVLGGFLLVSDFAITAAALSPLRAADKLRSVSPILRFPEHIDVVGKFLKTRLRNSDSLVIDDKDEESNEIAALSGLPVEPGDRLFVAGENNQDVKTFWNFVSNHHPRYLVHAETRSSMTHYYGLIFPDGCAAEMNVKGLSLNCILSRSQYRVFEILSVPHSR